MHKQKKNCHPEKFDLLDGPLADPLPGLPKENAILAVRVLPILINIKLILEKLQLNLCERLWVFPFSSAMLPFSEAGCTIARSRRFSCTSAYAYILLQSVKAYLLCRIKVVLVWLFTDMYSITQTRRIFPAQAYKVAMHNG